MTDAQTNGAIEEKSPARPLAIHCYAAFTDGVIRGLWIDMDHNVVHIEGTPLSQVPRDMMQILDPSKKGMIEKSMSEVPKPSENLLEANRLTEQGNMNEVSGGRENRRRRSEQVT